MNAPLSVWTTYYYDLTPEDAVLELKKNGILAAELSDEHGAVLLKRGDPKTVGATFCRFLENEGFTMTQGHLWLSIKLCSNPDAYEQLLPWLDLYAAIGIKNAVLHAERFLNEEITDEERFARNLAVLKRLETYVKGKGIRICLENLSGFLANVEWLMRFMAELDPDCFGICLDTGHLHLCGDGDQRRFILAAGDRLHALHIADNDGSRDQHLIPYGLGRVDLAAVIGALREVNYEGLFNYEIPGERHAPMPILAYKLEYIRKCYTYLMQ
ncbi:MAG: sugar phosphate isomerase/epimerase [Clostridia bacterium]|nr:sugar phosphate isomerase/epimerase [Clostridia bacterium]